MAYLDKIKLVEYMLQKHEEINQYTMSPIKVQKTLYYLYAMWGGNVRLLNKDLREGAEVCEQDIALDEDLFEPSFAAWKYGPVDSDIYYLYKHGELNDSCNAKELISTCPEMENQLIPFIDHIIKQTSEISDFTLVDMTHDDECWKIAYERRGVNDYMDKDSIKNEYEIKLNES